MNKFIFTTPLQVEKKDGEVYVEGHISTSHKDLVNDIVTSKCLESMLNQIRERNIKLDIEHEAFRGESSEEKELNKTIVPIGRIIDGTLDEKGLKIKGMINKFHNRYNEVKGSLDNQFLDAFSIAFIPTRTSRETKDGEDIRLLDDLRLLNVAFTGNPVNTTAQITEIFTKSVDSLRELDDEEKSKLEVKNKREGYPKDEEDEKKKPNKKSNSHSENNYKEVNMEGKDENAKSEEAEAVEPVASEPKEPEAEAEAKSPEEAKSDVSELKKEIADLKDLVNSLVEKETKAKEKAIVEKAKPFNDETIEPLTLIR